MLVYTLRFLDLFFFKLTLLTASPLSSTQEPPVTVHHKCNAAGPGTVTPSQTSPPADAVVITGRSFVRG